MGNFDNIPSIQNHMVVASTKIAHFKGSAQYPGPFDPRFHRRFFRVVENFQKSDISRDSVDINKYSSWRYGLFIYAYCERDTISYF